MAYERKARKNVKSNLDEIYKDYRSMYPKPSVIDKLSKKEFLKKISEFGGECTKALYRNIGEGAGVGSYIIMKKIREYYLKKEGDIFKKISGGKTLCTINDKEVIVLEDIVSKGSKPKSKCLYYNYGNSVKSIQVTANGVYAELHGFPSSMNSVVYFAKNTSVERSLVDNDLIPKGYFKYDGIRQYESRTGTRSVHSFSRIQQDPFEGALFIKNPSKH